MGGEWKVRSTEPEQDETVIGITGTGADDPTKRVGRGVTITWVSTGRYRITWASAPGIFEAVLGPVFGADTASDVKGYTLTRGAYSSAARTLDLYVWDSTFTAADLAAAQYLDLTVRFKQTALTT
jgi:hypothetical protein